MLASRYDHASVIETLLNNGAQVDFQDSVSTAYLLFQWLFDALLVAGVAEWMDRAHVCIH